MLTFWLDLQEAQSYPFQAEAVWAWRKEREPQVGPRFSFRSDYLWAIKEPDYKKSGLLGLSHSPWKTTVTRVETQNLIEEANL